MTRETTSGLLRAMTTLILRGPGTPMLLQGQEFGSSRPFHYFADVPDNICELVRNGRKEFMTQWRTVGQSGMLHCLKDPCTAQAFEDSKLNWDDVERNRSMLNLHTDLLRLRREDPVLSRWARGHYDGAVLGSHAFVIRSFSTEHGDRLLAVNLGRDLHYDPAPEPLLAPPEGGRWDILFTTEDPQYGGCGTALPDTEDNWRLGGHSALVLKGVRA